MAIAEGSRTQRNFITDATPIREQASSSHIRQASQWRPATSTQPPRPRTFLEILLGKNDKSKH